MLHHSVPLINTGDSELGMMNKQDWENVEKVLFDQADDAEKKELQDLFIGKVEAMIVKRNNIGNWLKVESV